MQHKNTLNILKAIYDTDQTSYNKLTAEDYQTMVEKIKSTADANKTKFKEARLNKKALQDILGEDLAEDTRYFKFARQSKSDIIKHYLDMEKAADENSEDEENKQLESNINKIIDNQENSSNLDKKRNDDYHFISSILFQFLPIQQQCILFYLEFLVVALEC